jgi:hypothetical protein
MTRSSTHMVWVTGDPTPMYGAMRNWLNFIVEWIPVRFTFWWSIRAARRPVLGVPLVAPSRPEWYCLEIGLDVMPVVLILTGG